MTTHRHRACAESEYRQSELKGTVTVVGDIVGPIVPEDQWECLAEIGLFVDRAGGDDSRSRQTPTGDDK